MENGQENKGNIGVTRQDMSLLHFSQLPMSSFGLLSMSFAQQIMDRGQSATAITPMFSLEYLDEEANGEQPQTVISPILNLDLRFLLQQMQRMEDERREASAKESQLILQQMQHSTEVLQETNIDLSRRITQTQHFTENNVTNVTQQNVQGDRHGDVTNIVNAQGAAVPSVAETRQNTQITQSTNDIPAERAAAETPRGKGKKSRSTAKTAERKAAGTEGAESTVSVQNVQMVQQDRSVQQNTTVQQTVREDDVSSTQQVMQGDSIVSVSGGDTAVNMANINGGDTVVQIKNTREGDRKETNITLVREGDVYRIAPMTAEQRTAFHLQRMVERAATLQQEHRERKNSAGMRLIGGEAAATLAQAVDKAGEGEIFPQFSAAGSSELTYVQEQDGQTKLPGDYSVAPEKLLEMLGQIQSIETEQRESSEKHESTKKHESTDQREDAPKTGKQEKKQSASAKGAKETQVTPTQSENDTASRAAEITAAEAAKGMQSETPRPALRSVYLPRTAKAKRAPLGAWEPVDTKRGDHMRSAQIEMLFSNVIQAEQNLGLTYGKNNGGVPTAPQERAAYLKSTTELVARREQLAEALSAIPSGVLPQEELAFIETITERPGMTERLISAAENVVYRTLRLTGRTWAIPESAAQYALEPLPSEKRSASAGSASTAAVQSGSDAVPSGRSAGAEVPADAAKQSADNAPAAIPTAQRAIGADGWSRTENAAQSEELAPAEMEYLAEGETAAAQQMESAAVKAMREAGERAARALASEEAAAPQQTAAPEEKQTAAAAKISAQESIRGADARGDMQTSNFPTAHSERVGAESIPSSAVESGVTAENAGMTGQKSAAIAAASQQTQSESAGVLPQTDLHYADEKSAEGETADGRKAAQQSFFDRLIHMIQGRGHEGAEAAQQASDSEAVARAEASGSAAQRSGAVDEAFANAGISEITAERGAITATQAAQGAEATVPQSDRAASQPTEIDYLTDSHTADGGEAAAQSGAMAAKLAETVLQQSMQSAEAAARVATSGSAAQIAAEAARGESAAKAQTAAKSGTSAAEADAVQAKIHAAEAKTAAQRSGAAEAATVNAGIPETTAERGAITATQAAQGAEATVPQSDRAISQPAEIDYLSESRTAEGGRMSGTAAQSGAMAAKLAETVLQQSMQSAEKELQRSAMQSVEVAARAAAGGSAAQTAAEAARGESAAKAQTASASGTFAVEADTVQAKIHAVEAAAAAQRSGAAEAATANAGTPEVTAERGAITAAQAAQGAEATVPQSDRAISQPAEIDYLSESRTAEGGRMSGAAAQLAETVLQQSMQSAEKELQRSVMQSTEAAQKASESEMTARTAQSSAPILQREVARQSASVVQTVLEDAHLSESMVYLRQLEKERGESVDRTETRERAGKTVYQHDTQREPGETAYLERTQQLPGRETLVDRVQRIPGETEYFPGTQRDMQHETVRTERVPQSVLTQKTLTEKSVTREPIPEMPIAPITQEYLQSGETVNAPQKFRANPIKMQQPEQNAGKSDAKTPDTADQPIEMSYVLQGAADSGNASAQAKSGAQRAENPLAANASDSSAGMPDWTRDFLENGSSGGAEQGSVETTAIPAQKNISWSAPTRNAQQYAVQPPEEIVLKDTAPQEPESARISEREIRRTADKVYKILEERLRSERRRHGF